MSVKSLHIFSCAPLERQGAANELHERAMQYNASPLLLRTSLSYSLSWKIEKLKLLFQAPPHLVEDSLVRVAWLLLVARQVLGASDEPVGDVGQVRGVDVGPLLRPQGHQQVAHLRQLGVGPGVGRATGKRR